MRGGAIPSASAISPDGIRSWNYETDIDRYLVDVGGTKETPVKKGDNVVWECRTDIFREKIDIHVNHRDTSYFTECKRLCDEIREKCSVRITPYDMRDILHHYDLVPKK